MFYHSSAPSLRCCWSPTRPSWVNVGFFTQRVASLRPQIAACRDSPTHRPSRVANEPNVRSSAVWQEAGGPAQVRGLTESDERCGPFTKIRWSLQKHAASTWFSGKLASLFNAKFQKSPDFFFLLLYYYSHPAKQKRRWPSPCFQVGLFLFQRAIAFRDKGALAAFRCRKKKKKRFSLRRGWTPGGAGSSTSSGCTLK